MTKQFQHIHYHNQYTVTIVLCIGPLEAFQKFYTLSRSEKINWPLFVNIYPLLIYANIYNMIVGFSISFGLLLLQYYSLTITTNVSSFI